MQLAVYISGFLLIHHPSSFWIFQCYMFPISVLKMQKDACTHTQTHTHTLTLIARHRCMCLRNLSYRDHVENYLRTRFTDTLSTAGGKIRVCTCVSAQVCVCVRWGIFRVFLTWLIKTETLVSPDKKGVSLIELDYSLQTHTGWMNSFIWVLCPLVVI